MAQMAQRILNSTIPVNLGCSKIHLIFRKYFINYSIEVVKYIDFFKNGAFRNDQSFSKETSEGEKILLDVFIFCQQHCLDAEGFL